MHNQMWRFIKIEKSCFLFLSSEWWNWKFEFPQVNGGNPKASDALSGELWEIKKERIRKASVYGKLPGWDLRSVSSAYQTVFSLLSFADNWNGLLIIFVLLKHGELVNAWMLIEYHRHIASTYIFFCCRGFLFILIFSALITRTCILMMYRYLPLSCVWFCISSRMLNCLRCLIWFSFLGYKQNMLC
jgi:hypothetical protein